MTVTATEFKMHLGYYLEMAGREDIYITKNNKRIAKLTNPSGGKEALDRLVGIAADQADMTLEEIKEERLSRQ